MSTENDEGISFEAIGGTTGQMLEQNAQALDQISSNFTSFIKLRTGSVVLSMFGGRKLWGFPRFVGDCASVHRKSNTGSSFEQKFDISNTCSQMILELQDVYDPNKINIKIKIISGSPCGAVAAEVKKSQANWVVLDKHLKHEVKQCMEDLQCNIVAMNRSQPKVLRLNLVGSPKNKEDQPTGGSQPQARNNILTILNAYVKFMFQSHHTSIKLISLVFGYVLRMHPLPTPVYRPRPQKMEQPAQTDDLLSDAETIAKYFGLVLTDKLFPFCIVFCHRSCFHICLGKAHFFPSVRCLYPLSVPNSFQNSRQSSMW